MAITVETVEGRAPVGTAEAPSRRWSVGVALVRSTPRLRWSGTLVGVVVVAAALRIHTALASFETADERTWMERSRRFWDALAAGDLGAASAAPEDQKATMPGIVTIWIGNAARGVWALGTQVGLWTNPEPASHGGHSSFALSRSGLNLGQMGVAVVTSLLIGVVMVLLRRWIGPVAAVVAGVLMATEPFLVAHGAVLHTDELMTLFGVAALLAAALVLGIPQPAAGTGDPRLAVATGALLAGALLTKVSALVFLPPLGLLSLFAVIRAGRRGRGPRPSGRLLVWTAVGLVVPVLLTYPALWADPAGELRLLGRSVMLGEEAQRQYFLGEPTETPGPAFYLVVLPLRVTPWLLVTAMVSGVAAWWNRGTRGTAAVLLTLAVPPFVTLSLAAKQFDRYALVLVVVAAITVGLVAEAGWDALASRYARGRARGGAVVAAAAVAAMAVMAHSAAVSPYGLAYFNPVLGGSQRAVGNVPVGWGEGLEQVGQIIYDLEEGQCDDVTVTGGPWLTANRHCGRPAPRGEIPTYTVVSVTMRQALPGYAARRTDGRELVAVVTIRGIDYIRVYGPRHDPPSS